MAKQIIILSTTPASGSNQNIACVFWLTVPAGAQIPIPGAISQFHGASSAEIQALRSGVIVEQGYSATYPNGYTLAQIESALLVQYQQAQNIITGLSNPNVNYGVFFDGVGWNASTATNVSAISTQDLNFGSALPGAAGDNIIISGVLNQRISIQQMILTAVGAVTVEIKDGSNIIGAFQFPAGGGSYSLPFTGRGWFITAPGNNFTLNLSAAVQCSITGWYQQA